MVEHLLTMGATQALQQLAFNHGESSRANGGQHLPEPAAPEREAGAEEKEAWEGDWDDEKTPNEWYKSDTVDPAVDPGRCQDANGGEDWEVGLSPFAIGAELDLCQRCSSRTAEKDGGDGKDAAGSSGKRRQMGGGDSTKVEAPRNVGHVCFDLKWFKTSAGKRRE